MGLLGRGKQEGTGAPTGEELQKIKAQVENQKIEKNDEEPPPKLKKTDFVENSQNLNDIGSQELKLIKILNEIENVKGRVDDASRKVIEEVRNLASTLDHVGDLVKDVPKETLSELRNMKKNLPTVYGGLTQSVGEHIKARVVSAIDSNILKVVKDAGRINSTDLLAKIESSHICSKNTLYVHLTRLEEDGYLARKREMHEVYYTVPENVKKDIASQEEEQAPRAPAEEPVQEAPKPPPAPKPATKPAPPPKEEPAPTEEEAPEPEPPKAAPAPKVSLLAPAPDPTETKKSKKKAA